MKNLPPSISILFDNNDDVFDRQGGQEKEIAITLIIKNPIVVDCSIRSIVQYKIYYRRCSRYNKKRKKRANIQKVKQ